MVVAQMLNFFATENNFKSREMGAANEQKAERRRRTGNKTPKNTSTQVIDVECNNFLVGF